MFGPWRDLSLKLQDFFAGYLNPASPRNEVEGERQTTGSDSPWSTGKRMDKLDWVTPEDRSEAGQSFTASICETSESVLIQPMPHLQVSPAKCFPVPSDPRVSTPRANVAEALLSAARHNDAQGCRMLMSQGSEADLRVPRTDTEGRTALHWAALNGSTDISKMLITLSADLGARDKLGRTPLHCACLGEHIPVAKFLISRGADLNATDNDGNTALHHAAAIDNEDLVSTLLRLSANVRTRNLEGRVALDLAGPKTAPHLKVDAAKRHKTAPSRKGNKVPIKDSSQEEIDVLLGKGSFAAVGTRAKKPGPEDYELQCLLGKGSFGEVYLVRKKQDGRLFAMKVMRKELIVGQHLVKYAKTERNVLSYIKHPFIISLSAAFQTPEHLFLLLDYCPGGDMGYHLARDKRFSEHRARIYASEVLLAIEELHERDIIFRDLKPENVVFDAQGHAILTDFGLSKENVGLIRGATSFCGSLAYLAPEMIKRRGHGKAVDWYLFGVLIFEMLTGSPPYFCPNRDQLIRNILYASLTLPSYLSEDAKSLIEALMERNPGKRLGSGQLGAEEIKQHPFFRGVHWPQVLRREMRPPVLSKPLSSPAPLCQSHLFGANAVLDPGTHVEGWSFVSP